MKRIMPAVQQFSTASLLRFVAFVALTSLTGDHEKEAIALLEETKRELDLEPQSQSEKELTF